MHQTYLSLLGMAAFTNAIGPDVLGMLGGLPGGGKHSEAAATQEAAALNTAAAEYPESRKAYGYGHGEEKSEAVEDYTHIYISSGTEVVEMATTTLYYPLTLRDAGVASATDAAAAPPTDPVSADSLPIDNLPSADTLPVPAADTLPVPAADTLPVPAADTLPVPAADTLPLPAADTLPVPGLKRDSSSATGASGGSEHEWAPMEAEFPQEEAPEEDFEPSSTFALRSTTSSILIATPTIPAVGAPAAANPLGSLPVLGGLGGGLPVKRHSSSATGAGSAPEHHDEDSSSAAGAIGGSGRWAPHREQEVPEEEAPFESSSTIAFRSLTSTLPIATPTLPAVGAPAAANPLGSLPVLGGLGGGLPVKRHSSSATGAGDAPEHEQDEDSSSASGAIGGSEHQWAPMEEEFPAAKEPEATTFQTRVRSSTSSLALPVGTPAAANPLGSLPVLGGLGGLKERQLPDAAAIQALAQQAAQAQAQSAVASATKKAAAAAASATKASSPLQGLPLLGGLGGLGGLKERQVPDAAEISQLAAGRVAAATQNAGNEIASATKKAKSAGAAATKAASPLQGLPVLGGLGGLGGI